MIFWKNQKVINKITKQLYIYNYTCIDVFLNPLFMSVYNIMTIVSCITKKHNIWS